MHRIAPTDICLMSSVQEQIELSDCDDIASIASHVYRDLQNDHNYSIDMTKYDDDVDGWENRFRKIWLEKFEQSPNRKYTKTTVIACLNRQYACDHGYNFFAPFSSSLVITQKGVQPQYDTLYNANVALSKKCHHEDHQELTSSHEVVLHTIYATTNNYNSTTNQHFS
jgi:hypothetical protein